MESTRYAQTGFRPLTGRGFVQDVGQLLMRPGAFFAALPRTKRLRDALMFMGVTALLYSLAATVFTPAGGLALILLYLLNALGMPLLTALLLHPVLLVLAPGRFDYGRLLALTAYTNVVLLFAWIPGLAPWAELLKYGLIGLGLTRVGGIGGWKAFGAVVAAAMMLVLLIYGLQHVMQR